MDDARAERAARQLVEARGSGRKLAGFSDRDRPASVEEALAVQRHVTRLTGSTVPAWKVGAPPGSGTTYAPIYAGDVFTSPAAVSSSRYPNMNVEGEIAFRLRRALPAHGRPYSAEQVADAVEGVCAAIEVGVSRLSDFTGSSIPEKIADNLGNGAFVYAAVNTAWRSLDWRALHVVMTVNGATEVDRTGGKPGGAPFDLLLWGANNIGSDGLSAGALVTTGTWTGWYPARTGDEIVVRFDAVGDVVLRVKD